MMTDVKINKDVFSLSELFLLSDATEQKFLFGLPDRTPHALLNPNYLEDALLQLEAKGILDEQGKISHGGAIIIKAIQEYAESIKYVQINNLMIGFSKTEPDNLIVLTEERERKEYLVTVADKLIVLREIFQNCPLISREPLEDEKTFVTKRMRNKELRAISEKEISDNCMYLECYDSENLLVAGENGWLVYIENDYLYTTHLEDNKRYRASQYWLIKQIFDFLDIPYQRQKVGE